MALLCDELWGGALSDATRRLGFLVENGPVHSSTCFTWSWGDIHTHRKTHPHTHNIDTHKHTSLTHAHKDTRIQHKNIYTHIQHQHTHTHHTQIHTSHTFTHTNTHHSLTHTHTYSTYTYTHSHNKHTSLTLTLTKTRTRTRTRLNMAASSVVISAFCTANSANAGFANLAFCGLCAANTAAKILTNSSIVLFVTGSEWSLNKTQVSSVLPLQHSPAIWNQICFLPSELKLPFPCRPAPWHSRLQTYIIDVLSASSVQLPPPQFMCFQHMCPEAFLGYCHGINSNHWFWQALS